MRNSRRDHFAPARFPAFKPDAGGYESYYLKAASPDGRRAVWIRNTVHQAPGHGPLGSLWFVLFDRESGERPYAVKQTIPQPAALVLDQGLIAIGKAQFALTGLSGAASGEGRSASWDLKLSGAAEPLLHLPERLYGAPVPRTKSLTLLPDASVDGVVTADERSVDLNGWRGMVGHNWGAQHAEQWVWLYGDGLHDGERGGVAWLDLVAGRIRLGPVTTPWIANGALNIDGVRHRLGGIGRVASTSVSAEVGRCVIELGGAGVRVKAQFDAPREQTVVWRYADPDGAEHHALNCSISALEVWIERRAERMRMVTESRAVYEWGTRETGHGLPVEPFADGEPPPGD